MGTAFWQPHHRSVAHVKSNSPVVDLGGPRSPESEMPLYRAYDRVRYSQEDFDLQGRIDAEEQIDPGDVSDLIKAANIVADALDIYRRGGNRKRASIDSLRDKLLRAAERVPDFTDLLCDTVVKMDGFVGRINSQADEIERLHGQVDRLIRGRG